MRISIGFPASFSCTVSRAMLTNSRSSGWTSSSPDRPTTSSSGRPKIRSAAAFAQVMDASGPTTTTGSGRSPARLGTCLGSIGLPGLGSVGACLSTAARERLRIRIDGILTRYCRRPMEALVTGGAGFIGSHLVDALVARGDGVRVLDDLSTGRRENVAADVELIEGSVADEAAVARAVAGVEVVF